MNPDNIGQSVMSENDEEQDDTSSMKSCVTVIVYNKHCENQEEATEQIVQESGQNGCDENQEDQLTTGTQILDASKLEENLVNKSTNSHSDDTIRNNPSRVENLVEVDLNDSVQVDNGAAPITLSSPGQTYSNIVAERESFGLDRIKGIYERNLSIRRNRQDSDGNNDEGNFHVPTAAPTTGMVLPITVRHESLNEFINTEGRLVCISRRLRNYFGSIQFRSNTESSQMYQFFKSVRSEFMGSLLFSLMTAQALISIRLSNMFRGEAISSLAFQLVKSILNLEEINHTNINRVANGKNETYNHDNHDDHDSRDSKDLKEQTNRLTVDPNFVQHLDMITERSWDRVGVQFANSFVLAFVVASLTQIFGHISGAHLSPAISIGLYVKGHISKIRMGAYLVAQALGSLLGLILLTALTSSRLSNDEASRLLLIRTKVGPIIDPINTNALFHDGIGNKMVISRNRRSFEISSKIVSFLEETKEASTTIANTSRGAIPNSSSGLNLINGHQVNIENDMETSARLEALLLSLMDESKLRSLFARKQNPSLSQNKITTNKRTNGRKPRPSAEISNSSKLSSIDLSCADNHKLVSEPDAKRKLESILASVAGGVSSAAEEASTYIKLVNNNTFDTKQHQEKQKETNSVSASAIEVGNSLSVGANSESKFSQLNYLDPTRKNHKMASLAESVRVERTGRYQTADGNKSGGALAIGVEDEGGAGIGSGSVDANHDGQSMEQILSKPAKLVVNSHLSPRLTKQALASSQPINRNIVVVSPITTTPTRLFQGDEGELGQPTASGETDELSSLAWNSIESSGHGAGSLATSNTQTPIHRAHLEGADSGGRGAVEKAARALRSASTAISGTNAKPTNQLTMDGKWSLVDGSADGIDRLQKGDKLVSEPAPLKQQQRLARVRKRRDLSSTRMSRGGGRNDDKLGHQSEGDVSKTAESDMSASESASSGDQSAGASYSAYRFPHHSTADHFYTINQLYLGLPESVMSSSSLSECLLAQDRLVLLHKRAELVRQSSSRDSAAYSTQTKSTTADKSDHSVNSNSMMAEEAKRADHFKLEPKPDFDNDANGIRSSDGAGDHSKPRATKLGSNFERYFSECLNLSNGAQMFLLQFIASVIIVVGYLINVDPRRSDAGFRSLSIGFVYFIANMLTIQAGGLYVNPFHVLWLTILGSGPYEKATEWEAEWIIYFICPLIAGLFGAMSHDYIDYLSDEHDGNARGRVLHLRRSFYSLNQTRGPPSRIIREAGTANRARHHLTLTNEATQGQIETPRPISVTDHEQHARVQRLQGRLDNSNFSISSVITTPTNSTDSSKMDVVEPTTFAKTPANSPISISSSSLSGEINAGYSSIVYQKNHQKQVQQQQQCGQTQSALPCSLSSTFLASPDASGSEEAPTIQSFATCAQSYHNQRHKQSRQRAIGDPEAKQIQEHVSGQGLELQRIVPLKVETSYRSSASRLASGTVEPLNEARARSRSPDEGGAQMRITNFVSASRTNEPTVASK